MPPTKKAETTQKKDTPPQHYYGDTVRRLFIFAAVVMLVGLPFFADRLSAPLVLVLFAILLVALFAGLTNPRQQWVAVLNIGISLIVLIVFEYYAIMFYAEGGSFQLLFWIVQVLAVSFLFALYFSVKMLRGMLLSK